MILNKNNFISYLLKEEAQVSQEKARQIWVGQKNILLDIILHHYLPKDFNVLDAAWTGYGSFILSKKSKNVLEWIILTLQLITNKL